MWAPQSVSGGARAAVRPTTSSRMRRRSGGDLNINIRSYWGSGRSGHFTESIFIETPAVGAKSPAPSGDVTGLTGRAGRVRAGSPS